MSSDSATAVSSSAEPSAASTTGSEASSIVVTVSSTPLTADGPKEETVVDRLLAERPRPYNIGHRGFRARYPENAMAAFVAAVDEGGAHGLETDLHLTRDGVVVLSHDPTLRRCFGRPEKLADCTWSFLAPLRTTSGAGEPLARLSDLLAFLSLPGREALWVLLDVKRDDDADTLLRRTAETLAAAPGDWSRRIVLGCWDANYMRAARDHLPALPRAYIGISLAYADALLHGCPDAVQAFNLLQPILVGGRGARFLAQARAAGKPVLVWTVNAPEWMAWSIHPAHVAGVITDDPALFRAVSEGDNKVARHTTSFTGLHLRRWVRLYAWVGLVRTLERVFDMVLWLREGTARARIERAWTKE